MERAIRRSRAPRLLVLVAAVTAVTVSTQATAWAATHPPDPSPPPPPLTWGPCASAALAQAGAECTLLPVPLDHDRPDGPTVELALSRIRHKTPDAQYQGIMLINPGGPGGSGLGLSRLGARVPDHAGDAYDWIGFDPRGVGSSRPALSCIPDYMGPGRPEYVPRTGRTERAWLARSQGYADACEDHGGELLDHLTTVDNARDLDAIRAALGEPAINYYGYSYGTYLGQVYATLYPRRVRRMVLDSNVDPRNVWYQANLNQDIAFEKVFQVWFAWVADHDDVYHLGATGDAVEQRWYAEQAGLRHEPAGGVVGPAEWTDAFVAVGYTQAAWTELAGVFAGWVHERAAAPVVAAYEDADGPGDDNLYAIYLATECTDAAWPTDWSRWERDNWRTHRQAPMLTWNNAWFNAPCAVWPAEPHRPVRVDGGRVPGVLLVDETLDAPTPFEGSLEVRRRFPRSSLIALPGGTTHGASLKANACVDDQVAAYLRDGTLPVRRRGDGPDATCAPLPVPVPAPAAAVPATASTGASLGRLPHGLG